jgi:hypothetical protein
MTRSNFLTRGAMIFCAALLLMLGTQTKAHADEFAAGNAALLDPFDPVPQIRFSDCYNDCGYRHDCYDGCGYRRHCYDGCRHYGWRGWRDGWRCDHDCYDHTGWHCERDCGPDPTTFGKMWLDRIQEYDRQSRDWKGDMHEWHDAMGEWHEYAGRWLYRHGDWHEGPPHVYADYEWRQEGSRWRYWHNNDWHDDGYDGRWHDGHH